MANIDIPKILSAKHDIVFRQFFADERNLEDLAEFLKAVLRLPDDEYEKIEIVDPNMLPDYSKSKYSVVDVKLYTKSRKVIHIEIQLKVTSELPKRLVFYMSKLITEQLGSSEDYEKINRAISIVITDEKLVKQSPRYNHRFRLYDCEAGVEFTDLVEINTIELSKLPPAADGSSLYDWACFIKADTEEELNMLQERNPKFAKPILKLRELSADEKMQYAIEQKLKAERDQRMFERDAEKRGMERGMERGEQNATQRFLEMLEKGMSADEIKLALQGGQ